ncbi:unnamed protein product [Gongylonema pulchrum]|uniref:Glyco_hydr_116N domain-containing protein n=1 Tax=Gongylonema pulchrum TaxID=637853 RepID=A0A183DGC0_9BILA|nr:unnamed protein product [Gongylonema pulchrum]
MIQSVQAMKSTTYSSKNEKKNFNWDIFFLNLHRIACFRGLFPRSWTHYSVPEFDFNLCIRQISPVVPNDYKSLLHLRFEMVPEIRDGPVRVYAKQINSKSMPDHREVPLSGLIKTSGDGTTSVRT